MKSEFVMAINQICSERNLPQEVIFEAIESALVSAYKRNYGSGPNIKAAIDFTTGTPHVYAEQIVVENVEDERFEIALREARRIEPEAQIGSLVRTEVTPKSFGRIAAQTAKQVILQRIREAERDALFSSYADREGELINGMVANITSQAITLSLGRTEATMPRSQQVPGERYRIGQRIRAYVMEVRRTSRGPQIVVSRTHRQMLRRLLELEVPEIFSGTVEIKSIAREAGSRSKVAVAALQEGVDPVGSCVGIRGMRIQAIVNELGGEKIDVVAWSGDTSTFIGNALSPAKVSYVTLGNPDTDGKTATVVVPDDQLSLAIGKGGQNARLAAKLIGWRIDIKGSSEAQTEALKPRELAAAAPTRDRDILAMAEAILLGKEQPPIELELVPEAALSELIDDEGAEPVGAAVEPATSVELAMEEAAEPEASPILATAEALLQEQEPALAEAMEDELAFELEAEVAEEIVKELELAQVEEMAIEPKPAAAPEPVEEAPAARREPRRPRYEYVKDERLEALTQTDKKTGRGKRRQLVRDEESGELIAQRKHKRDDNLDEVDWKEIDY